MSHELRTPLHAITGFSLLRLTPLNSQQTDYINHLHAAAQHQQQLIGNALDIARINNQSLTLESRPFRLDLALREINSLIASQTRQHNLEYRSPPLDRLKITLLGDRTRLTQVLLNLLTNAVKYTPEGQIELNVAITPISILHCQIAFCGKGYRNRHCQRRPATPV
ncbi:MAG: histidine kinase dimerization/phospho-acceptor domain-containing protein [Thiothrix sp.]